jgi:phage shock protein PspC (stress-responsive transcriptional regulator)
LFLISGYKAYYDELLREYKANLAQLHGFDSPKVLREEVKKLVNLDDKSDESAKRYIKYAKMFEKEDSSRDSFLKTLIKLNPFARPFKKFYQATFGIDSVGTFELDEYFPRKMLKGVCAMLSASKGWGIETVRWITVFLGCFGIGVIGYIVLALGMKTGHYFGVNIEKP